MVALSPLPAAAQSPAVTIGTIQITSGQYLHESTGGGIAVSTSYSLASAPTATLYYQAFLEIVDDTGTAIILQNADAPGGTWVSSPVAAKGWPIVLPSLVGATLIPEQQLDPTQSYRVRMRVMYAEQQEGPFSVVAVDENPPQTYIDFPDPDEPDDPNIVTDVEQLWMIDPLALASADPGSPDGEFGIRARVKVDRWEVPGGPQVDPVQLMFRVWMFEDVGGTAVEVPLVEDSFSHVINIARSNFDGTGPATVTFFRDFGIRPVNQLDPVNGSYGIGVAVTHEEIPGQPPVYTSPPATLGGLRLFHYSGVFRVGSFDAEVASVDGFTFVASSTPDYLNVEQNALEAQVVTDDNQYRIELPLPSPPHALRLYANGDAEPQSSGPFALTPAITPDHGRIQGVEIRRVNLQLTTSGVIGDFTLMLPAGVGFTTDPASKLLESRILFINNSFRPATGAGLIPALAKYTHSVPGSTLYISEETKPVLFSASELIWEVFTGRIHFEVDGGASYVRENEYAYLENYFVPVLNYPPVNRTRRSNEQMYRSVSALIGDAHVDAANGGGLATEFEFQPGNVLMHFPRDTHVVWNGIGHMQVVADAIVPETSFLGNPEPITVPYSQDCSGSAGCGGGVSTATMTLDPGGDLAITPEGGLLLPGNVLPDASAILEWGVYIDSAQRRNVAHKINETLGEGSFLMAGNFVRGGDIEADPVPVFTGTDTKSISAGAFSILHTGYRPADFSAERPTHELDGSPYTEGLATYAGLNIALGNNASAYSGSARFQGGSALFTMRDTSRYNLRFAGVTGVHEADPGTFPPNMNLGGYQFGFDNFSLAFRGGKNVDSRTRGGITLPFPSDIIQPFEELTLSCRGQFDEIELPENQPSHLLSYWNATVEPLGLEFAKADNECADYNPVTLVMHGKTYVHHIDGALAGALYFADDGNLVPPSSAPDNNAMASRFQIPTTMSLPGPGSVPYELTSATSIYFNNPDDDAAPAPQQGYAVFSGELDVALFENLPIRLHTGTRLPNQTSAAAPYHVMSVTEHAPDTAVDLSDFDLRSHRGYPTNMPNVEAYRNPTGELYQSHARHEFLSAIDFSLPVRWNVSTRAFASSFQSDNFLLLTLNHKIPFLGPNQTEIAFSSNLAPLPIPNLTNLAFEPGLQPLWRSAVEAAITETATLNLIDGTESFESILSDLSRSLYAPILFFVEGANGTNHVENHIAALLADSALQNGADDPSEIAMAVDRHLTGTDPINSASFALGFTHQDTRNIIHQSVIARLRKATLDAINVVSMLETNLLSTNTEGDYQTLGVLAKELIKEISLYVVGEDLSGLAGELGSVAELFSNVHQTTKTTLGAQKRALTDVEADLTNLLTMLDDPFSEFSQEILQRVISDSGAAPGESINDAILEVGDELRTYFTQFADSARSIDSVDPVQIRIAVTESFYRHLAGADVTPRIGELIRQRFSDLNETYRGAVDSTFATVAGVSEDVLGELLQLADEEFSKMLGKSEGLFAANVRGYAHISDDAIRRLSMDLAAQLSLGLDFEVNGHLEINKREVKEGHPGCDFGTDGDTVDVTFNTETSVAEWKNLFSGERLDNPNRESFRVDLRFVFFEPNGGDIELVGAGGGFSLKSGGIEFGGFELKELGAFVFIGVNENYISGHGAGELHDFGLRVGAFFGKACDAATIAAVDPDARLLIGDPPFTGVYMTGGITVPLNELLGIPSEIIAVKASVGGSYFLFVNQPSLGGKYYASISGKVGSVISAEVGGEITIGGSLSNIDIDLARGPFDMIGGDLRAFGRARVWAELCALLCIEVSAGLEVAFDVDLTTKDLNNVDVSFDL
jgi:hypothetical protein